jgi:hypothetical protein
VTNARKREILDEINKQFYSKEVEYTDIDWSVKSIVSASVEDYFVERYADITFSGVKVSTYNVT